MATRSQRQWSGGYIEPLSPTEVGPAQPTQFELIVARLGLEAQPELWLDSRALYEWAKVHHNHRYIPEHLLGAWGLKYSGGWDA
jgi:hypothetical protein